MKKAFASQLPPQQVDTLQQLVTKHVTDPAFQQFVGTDDFSVTSTERGLQRWEQAHLVAALDVLNCYQRDRRARSVCQLGGLRFARTKVFKQDPRTRMVELLKRWLRTHAGLASVSEEEVRGICGLCRDILNHPSLFPARNPRSFLQSVAEVYDHLQRQLKEVLERDRTCAELAQRIISLSRNLISDAVGYLLLAPTDLRQTDSLPSLEVVALWQSLPDADHPLPGRADPSLQKVMRDAWATQCGSLVAAVLGTSWCVRLFNGARAEEEACRAVEDRASTRCLEDRPGLGRHSLGSIEESRGRLSQGSIEDKRGSCGRMSQRAVSVRSSSQPPCRSQEERTEECSKTSPSIRGLIEEVSTLFERGSFKGSGLAGAFRDSRDAEQVRVRQAYLESTQLVFDLIYLLSEVLVQFHRVSDGLGDYGMIRMSPWLHPILDSLIDKVQRLKANLELIGEAVDKAYVLARARGTRVEKPAPSDRMCSRARTCIERAATGRGSHAQALLQAVEELKARSAPERLPAVAGSLGDACSSLQAILLSAEFRASVGDAFPELPPLTDRSQEETESVRPGRGMVLQISDCAASYEEEPPSATEVYEVTGEPEERAVSNHSTIGELARRPPPLPCGKSHGSTDSGKSTSASLGSSSLSLASGSALRGMADSRSASSSRASSAQRASHARPSSVPALRRRTPSAERCARLPPRETLLAVAWEAPGRRQPAGLDFFGVEVYFVTPSRIGRGLKRRDRRSLMIEGGRLHICSRGSSTQVELAVDPAGDIEACALHPQSMLSLSVRRVPEGALAEDGVFELDDFMFEFDSDSSATAFHKRLITLARRG